MRYSFNGMFDNCAKHGPITGTGEQWDSANAAFQDRLRCVQSVGTWRKAPSRWKHNDGPYIDPDWYIVDWGQHG